MTTPDSAAPQGGVAVTQADREIAAAILEGPPWRHDRIAAMVRAGKADDHQLVCCAARSRLSSPPPAQQARVEDALREVERLTALCKANNDLARMNGEHRDQWRGKAIKLANALEGAIAEIQDGRLYETMCCSGQDCGCRGSSNADLLIHELRAALSSTNAAPDARTLPADMDGMVVVPREPTLDMQDAATEVWVDNGIGGGTALNWSEAASVWSAMIAAAPPLNVVDHRERGDGGCERHPGCRAIDKTTVSAPAHRIGTRLFAYADHVADER